MDQRVVMIFDLRVGDWLCAALRSWYARTILTGLVLLFMSLEPLWSEFEKSCTPLLAPHHPAERRFRCHQTRLDLLRTSDKCFIYQYISLSSRSEGFCNRKHASR